MEENNIIVRGIWGGGTATIKKECNIRSRLPNKNCLECRYYKKLNQNSFICEYFTEAKEVSSRFNRSFLVGFACGLVFAIIICAALSLSGCGESPDSFAVRGTEENTDNETLQDTYTETDSYKDGDSDTPSDKETELSTNMETDSDSDFERNTDTDTDTVVEASTEVESDMDTDDDTVTDTDEDTDTNIDTDTDTETGTGETDCDFFCQQDNHDTTISNGCPFDMNTQGYVHCVTRPMWVCPIIDSVQYFGWNNYGTEWAICDETSGTPVCPAFYVCVQTDEYKFGTVCSNDGDSKGVCP
jgi:hypothetical protein